MDAQTGVPSLSDIAAITKNGDMDNCWWFIILFAMIFGWGGYGFGGNRGGAPVQQDTLTTPHFDDALHLQTLTQGQRDIVDNVNANKYDIVTNTNAVESRLTASLASLLANQQANAQAQQACCADIKYNSAMNTAAINANTTEQTQKVLDAIQTNRMAQMQDQINALQSQLAQSNYMGALQQATAGVVRYPMATTYNSGANPFCSCNCASM